jgi:two-component system LytT family response regulator
LKIAFLSDKVLAITPYGTGFDLLKMMPHMKAMVIFITAFDQYAVTAFRYAALDYLLKPVNIEQLQGAVKRAEQQMDLQEQAMKYTALLHNLDKKEVEQKEIVLTDKGQLYVVRFVDIMYIIADGSYTHIYTTQRSFVTTRNLKDFEELLPKTLFCRIHHGHMVNKYYIVRIQKSRGGIVYMSDGKKLELAVRRKDAFLTMMKGQ